MPAISPYIYPVMPMRGTRRIRKPILIIRPDILAAQVKAVLLIPLSMLERLVFKYIKGHITDSRIV